MWRSFARLLTQFDRNKLDPAIAFRNAAGVAVPLAVGVAIGMPLGGIAVATGALQVAYSDGHDPYSRRGFRMFLATLLCALAVVIGGITGRHHVMATLAVVAWGFAAGVVVLLGAEAESLGIISLVTLIIYAAQGLTTERAVNAGLLALGGGLLQTGFSIALWPLSRHQPERRALATLYGELARFALGSMKSKEAPPGTSAMTEAQDALGRLGRDRDAEPQRLWSLLNQAERIRLRLLTLGRMRNRLSRHTENSSDLELIGKFLQLCAEVLQRIATILIVHKAPSSGLPALQAMRELADRYRELETSSETAFLRAVRRTIRRQMDAVAGQLRAASSLVTNQFLSDPRPIPAEVMPGWRTRLEDDLTRLRDNLTLESPAFRHAIRLAATLAIGEVMAGIISARRSYWLPMTIALVLKPEFSITVSRGLLRIAGTFAGLLLSTMLFHFLHPVMGMEVVLVTIFVFLVRWIGPANYGIFAINVSALVVLLVAFTGVSPTEVILARGLMTTLGGVTALAAYAVWPTWETTRSVEVVARMLEAYRLYFAAVVGRDLGSPRDTQADLDRTRTEARRARTQLEASLDRLRHEPVVDEADVHALNAILASSHRFINAVMAIEGAHEKSAAPKIGAVRRFAEDVDKTLMLLSSALRGQKISARDLPDLREEHHSLVSAIGLEDYSLLIDETDRVVNSLNTVVEQILAWRKSSRRMTVRQTRPA